MRVVCESFEDFLADVQFQIKENGPKAVADKTIRLSTTKHPVGEGEGKEAVRLMVTMHCSAIIVSGEVGYLLEAGEECGIDYNDATQEKNGSKAMGVKVAALGDFCDSAGLVIRPGVIEM